MESTKIDTPFVAAQSPRKDELAPALAKSELVARRLKLIANANRLRIACRVLQCEVSVGDLEIELGIRQPTLSREIAKLREGGVLTARRQSKNVFYSLTNPDMKRLIEAVCHASADDGIGLSSVAPKESSNQLLQPSFTPRPKVAQATKSIS